MNIGLRFGEREVQLSLTETLELAEGQQGQIGLARGRDVADLLPQIESLVQEFLSGYVADAPVR